MLAGCLSSVDENALDAVFQDLEKQNLVERLTGELAKRQTGRHKGPKRNTYFTRMSKCF